LSLQNAQYDAIMRIYAARRTYHRNQLEQRLELIHERIPVLKELESELISLAGAQARAAISGDTAAKAAKQQEWQKLTQLKQDLLLSHGFTPQDLELTYDCPDCKDTGYVGSDKCHCLRQAMIHHLYDQSHLSHVLARENFNTFTYDYYDEEDLPVIRRAVADAHLFIESFDREFRNLLLLGQPGTGKTFLCNCIAKELMDRCHSVVYLTAHELFDLLANAHFDRSPDASVYRQSNAYVFDCDLLIIDDLGTELNNSFVSSQLFLCINERILKQKSTIISSNLNLETLRDAYSERTLSRITGHYTIWQIPGRDIRIKKKLLGNT